MRLSIESALFLLLCPFQAYGLSDASFVTEVIQPKELSGIVIHRRRPLVPPLETVPAVILFGGFETGAQAIEVFEPSQPVQLLTFEYPFTPPRKLSFPGGLRYVAEAKEAIHATIEGIGKLVDWAATQPGIDPRGIVLVGASFGAPFVSIAAGNNTKVRALILAHGFADVPGIISFRLGQALEGLYGRPGRWLGVVLGRLLWWYAGVPSPERELAKLKQGQSVFLLTAKDDDLIPQSSIVALREAVAKSQARWEEKVLPGSHMRPGEAALVKQLLGESMSWLKREGISR